MNPIEKEDQQQSMTAALLDVKNLAQRCFELSSEMEKEKEHFREHELTIESLQKENDRRAIFSGIGEQAVQQQKKEILSNMRAIVHHTGERDRLQRVKNLLEDETLQPEEIQRIHKKVNEEFHALYPTCPSSSSPEEHSNVLKERDWAMYRIGNPC